VLIGRRAFVVVALALTSCTSSPADHPSTTRPSPASPAPLASATRQPAQPMLVWTSRRLDARLPARVTAMPGVRATVAVSGGTVWLTASADGSGRRVDRPPAGYAIPIEVAAADPGTYARLVPGAGGLATLRPGEVVLGTTSARLRHLGAGSALVFGRNTLHVAAVVADSAVGYAEVFATPGDAVRLGVATYRYLLADVEPASAHDVERRIVSLWPSPAIRVRLPGTARWLRAADAVLPPVLEKESFGEFAATKPARDGSIAVDPRWRAAHVASAAVPVLGTVTCNAALLGPLAAALRELVSRGLAHLVDPADYGGCYAARVVRQDDGGSLSHHAWGGAIDLNARRNPYGGRPRQDARLVAVFARHGFVWGGDWLVPDGMHFDYLGR
jgi:hypothetical protein